MYGKNRQLEEPICVGDPQEDATIEGIVCAYPSQHSTAGPAPDPGGLRFTSVLRCFFRRSHNTAPQAWPSRRKLRSSTRVPQGADKYAYTQQQRRGNHWRPSSAALQRRISSPLSVTQLVKLTRRLQSLRGGGRHDQRTRKFPGEALVIVANDPLAGKLDIAYIATAASETSSLKPSLTRAQRNHAGHEASPHP